MLSERATRFVVAIGPGCRDKPPERLLYPPRAREEEPASWPLVARWCNFGCLHEDMLRPARPCVFGTPWSVSRVAGVDHGNHLRSVRAPEPGRLALLCQPRLRCLPGLDRIERRDAGVDPVPGTVPAATPAERRDPLGSECGRRQ